MQIHKSKVLKLFNILNLNLLQEGIFINIEEKYQKHNNKSNSSVPKFLQLFITNNSELKDKNIFLT